MLDDVVSPPGLVLQLRDLEEAVLHRVVGEDLGPRGHGPGDGGWEVHAVDCLMQDGAR